ncbi:MAG: transcriptional repressor [Clostridia bacterium]|nr:transcriptional repressor [Clostridia bacterium]
MTRNSKLILDIINKSKDHMTAEQLYFYIREHGYKVSSATVYNNLSYLYDQGLIRRISSVNGGAERYDSTVRHDHLVCKICGKISDMYLEDLTSHFQAEIKEQIVSYDLQIYYICSECRKDYIKNKKEIRK